MSSDKARKHFYDCIYGGKPEQVKEIRKLTRFERRLLIGIAVLIAALLIARVAQYHY